MIGGLLALLIRAEALPAGAAGRAQRRGVQPGSSPCTARSCCCCSRHRCSPASPTRSCRCRSARRTSRSRG
nr:hypothetical protein [Angustibacter aerolatus]